ncbi:hypothetical protein ACFSSA_13855 [Luteolibacter algae]|uniref:Lipoprotein n=1 Tax=Luteolibacter algae TaxID=454151 RepID=A0ABW5DCL2_9BACT
MKRSTILLSSVTFLLLLACEKEKGDTEGLAAKSPVAQELKREDMPLLPLKKGDYWKYNISVEVPAGITSEGASAVELDQEKIRTYVGKVKVAENLPETDAFDVKMEGEPVQRELVEIGDDRVMMRGNTFPEMLDAKPMWLDPAIPFVIAGVRPGQEMTKLSAQDGARKRGIKVVAREKITVPAGEYKSIRLLMTGNDGKFELRRTIWFAPGIGIVKEEKTRYVGEKLIFRETTELRETSLKGR